MECGDQRKAKQKLIEKKRIKFMFRQRVEERNTTILNGLQK